MKHEVCPVTPFAQNCSVLRCEETGRGAVVDPGGDLERIDSVIERLDVEVEKVLLTHAHIDHAGHAAKFARDRGIPIEGPHLEDKFWIDLLPKQGEMFGLPGGESFEPDRWLDEGDTVQFGACEMEVRHCPGHTPGHVVFFSAKDQLVFVGDCLFHGSIGRTDFPRGDHVQLLQSIRERILTLGDEVRFVPGHGPGATLGVERRTNPFLAG